MSETTAKEVLDVRGAAEFLGFAPYTIREKAREGQIPGRKVGGEWRFSRRALLDWLESPAEHTKEERRPAPASPG